MMLKWTTSGAGYSDLEPALLLLIADGALQDGIVGSRKKEIAENAYDPEKLEEAW